MQTKTVQIIFTLICLVVAAAAQELVPSFCGTKAPLLVIFGLYTASQQGRGWLFASLTAGAIEDALNVSPTPCCTFFTLFAAMGAHFLRPFVQKLAPAAVGASLAAVAAPIHELWLMTWDILPPNCPLLVRFFASILPAAAVGALVFAVLPGAERMAGLSLSASERRPL